MDGQWSSRESIQIQEKLPGFLFPFFECGLQDPSTQFRSQGLE